MTPLSCCDDREARASGQGGRVGQNDRSVSDNRTSPQRMMRRRRYLQINQLASGGLLRDSSHAFEYFHDT
jgi:hypothetical protein